ncbi:choice-of-anchor Q domain-containing protein [Candidatus Leptofilum sp.]|uniref:choice-of-anchor Q domain-containing protein n=1 Tax=Candidatus Leptofilum sp. TaxID=3241576 RepID=UPI003B5C3A29
MLQPDFTFQPKTSWLTFCLSLFVALLVGQLGVQPSKAGGNVWTVCQSAPPDDCDFDDINTAVNNASVMDGDILTFPVNRETYAPININNKEITLQGNNTEIDAADAGTAVTITNGSKTATFNDFTIQNGNSSNGAGILLNSGNLTLTDVSFNGNDATNDGGALYVSSSGSSVNLTDVTMQTNTAVASGGAIYNNGTLTADNLSLTDNEAVEGGGIYNNGTVMLNNQTAVQRNMVTQSGGGIYNDSGGDVTITDSDVSSNEAVNGAAVYNEGTLQVTNSNLGSSNIAMQAGGGLFNSGQATLLNSAVVQNDGATGAGIYNEGTLTATNSTFSRNEGANGAGLYNQSDTATLNNVTIHLTIGTSIFANGGTVNVGNTIISSVSGNAACGGSGNFNSNGYNLANDQSCTFLTATGDLQGLDPDLNGINSPADSAAYHAPKLTSPVIDAGNPAAPGSNSTACLATDQRGLERPQSTRCDIGAVEIEIFRLYVPAVLK